MKLNSSTTDALENGANRSEETQSESHEFIQRLSQNEFKEWYQQRQYSRNIRQGQSYFNRPGPIKAARRHSPSQLLRCKRKTIYQRLKAPKETEDPLGIFWVGSRIEEDLIMPYLEKCVAGEDQYVTNSMWVDFVVQTAAGKVRMKGSTDPVIVDEDAEPILPFEIKTKRSLDAQKQPDQRHRAQVHAYLRGLSKKHDSIINEAVLLYVSRTNFEMKAFQIKFDHQFWKRTVLPWMADVTAYQLSGELPPDDPEQEWECKYCSYRERCGKGEREVANMPPEGFLPLFDYSKENIIEYLLIHENAALTPYLAKEYPDLANEFDVQNWNCRGCNCTFEIDEIPWSRDSKHPPECPHCKNEGQTRFLRGELTRGPHSIHE